LNDLAKNVILWIVIAVVLLTVFQSFGPGSGQRAAPIAYSEFLSYIKDGSVDEVVFEGDVIRGKRHNNNDSFVT
jgi:cell division protease FtsH